MSPEQEAQLRYLMRKGKQLPMPKSELLKSVSKKFSGVAERMQTLPQQALEMEKAMESDKKLKERKEKKVKKQKTKKEQKAE